MIPASFVVEVGGRDGKMYTPYLQIVHRSRVFEIFGKLFENVCPSETECVGGVRDVLCFVVDLTACCKKHWVDLFRGFSLDKAPVVAGFKLGHKPISSTISMKPVFCSVFGYACMTDLGGEFKLVVCPTEANMKELATTDKLIYFILDFLW